jgi:hypothetical protein
MFTTLLLCTGGSPPSYILPSAYKGIFLKVLRLLFIHSLFNCSGEQSLHSSDVELQPMDIVNDLCRGMSDLLEQVIIIIFSLHMGEPLVLYLAMRLFIYTVLHHNFLFFYLIAFSEFISD